MKHDPYTVSALNKAIKYTIEPGFSSIQVKGEVTNHRLQASGHHYFSLKDENSQISCVFFKGYAAQCPIEIKPGDQIVVLGDLTVYEPRGSYQIVVKKAKKAGVGDLLAKIHALKMELEKLGWLDPAKKKPLPKFPKKIGVVTSPTGSVIQDIIHVLSRRFSGFELILNPVKVQGDGSAEEIAQAIDQMNAHQLADVLIVGRGGGSLEDLMPFNERCVAEAIHRSEIPIISAVGHETDVTIADFVADVRAPTPSAAAEIAMGEKGALIERLTMIRSTMAKQLFEKVGALKRELAALLRHPLLSDPFAMLQSKMQKLDDISSTLEVKMGHQLERAKLKLASKKVQRDGLNPVRQMREMRLKLAQYSVRLDQTMKGLLAQKSDKLVGTTTLYPID